MALAPSRRNTTARHAPQRAHKQRPRHFRLCDADGVCATVGGTAACDDVRDGLAVRAAVRVEVHVRAAGDGVCEFVVAADGATPAMSASSASSATAPRMLGSGAGAARPAARISGRMRRLRTSASQAAGRGRGGVDGRVVSRTFSKRRPALRTRQASACARAPRDAARPASSGAVEPDVRSHTRRGGAALAVARDRRECDAWDAPQQPRSVSEKNPCSDPLQGDVSLRRRHSTPLRFADPAPRPRCTLSAPRRPPMRVGAPARWRRAAAGTPPSPRRRATTSAG